MRDGTRRHVSGFRCLLLSLLLAWLPGLAQTTAQQQPPHIRVVSSNNYPPFYFLDAEGKPQGYEVDVWKLFEKHTGIQVELTLTDWRKAMQRMREGQADVIDMLYRTPLREESLDFSGPNLDLPVGIYVNHRLSGIQNTAALQGFPVGVQRGDACIDKLRAVGVTNLHLFNNYDAIVQEAMRDGILIFCMDQYPANYNLYRHSLFERFHQAFVLFTEKSYFAVRKGDARMLALIEHGMAKVTPAERTALKEKWLERPYILTPWIRNTGIALGAGLGVVVLMTLWIWTLGRSVRRRTSELSAEQAKLRALFDASPDAMWVKDLDGVYRECNDRTLDILGIERKQLIGQTDHTLFPPDELPEVLGTDAQAIQSGETRTCYMANTVADGSQKHLEVIKVPLKDDGGKIWSIFGIARDITSRTRLEDQLQLWGHAFQHAAFSMAVFDAKTQCIAMANPPFARERGYTPEEMIGMHVDCLYRPELRAEREASRQSTKHLSHYMVETEHQRRDGSNFPVLLDCSTTHDASGAPQQVIVYAQDCSARQQSERELRLAAVAFQTQTALMVLDADGMIQRVNAAFTSLTGYSTEEALNKRPSMLEAHGHERGFYQRMWTQIRSEGFWMGEHWISSKHRQLRLVRAEVSSVTDGAGTVRHYVCAMSDLTSEHEAQARAEHMALFDPLTDLPNRSFLGDRLQNIIDNENTSSGAVLLIDIDHFKRINDLRGHAIGDRLLASIAQRLRPLFSEPEILGRFSGGSFALLLPCPGIRPEYCASNVLASAERIRRALQEPFWLGNDIPITVTVSIGWTLLEQRRNAADAVLKEVELAMYAAKAAGRDRVHQFEPAMLAALERQEALAHDLLNAITGDTDGLDLHLQLQVDQQAQGIGAEALLRWTRPDGEQVPPDQFIPLAEDNGLILPLGDWVLQRACERLTAWATSPTTHALDLAINVSAMQFAQPSFAEDVRTALARSGADPQRLKLEITESTILADLEDTTAKLNQLRSLGIRISLDDFGTGYSSLAYLSRLPLDQLKIDKSFVDKLPDERNDATVAQTIIGMGRGLGLQVIAEGVETEAQHHFLASNGCDAFQGYYFARPLPLPEFEAMLHARLQQA